MAQDPNDAALIACLEEGRQLITEFIIDPNNGVCGTVNVTVYAAQINEINQLLAFLKAK